MMAVIAFSAFAVWVGMNFSDWRESFYQWRVNRVVRRQLDQNVNLRYPNGVTFRQLAADIKKQTTNGESPGGLILYVDVEGEGVDESGLTQTAILKIDVQSVPLKDALGSILKPMKLALGVQNGVVIVGGENDLPEKSKVLWTLRR
jgi:hypothetical protein